jgi:hypothetical protein
MARVQSKIAQTLRLTERNNRKDTQRREILGNACVYKNLEALTTLFYSEGAVSLLERNEIGFGILYYATGSTRGKIWIRHVKRSDLQQSVMHRILYWPWKFLNMDTSLNNITIKDFVVLLPKKGWWANWTVFHGDLRVVNRVAGALCTI